MKQDLIILSLVAMAVTAILAATAQPATQPTTKPATAPATQTALAPSALLAPTAGVCGTFVKDGRTYVILIVEVPRP